MNLLAATTLSTKKKAYGQYSQNLGFLLSRLQYVFVVEERYEGSELKYLLQIFHVTYPEAQEGKGWGKPHMADRSHFDKRFTLEELKAFLEDREFGIDEGWNPVEDGTNLAE